MPLCLPGQLFNYETGVGTIGGVGRKYTTHISGADSIFKLQRCTTLGNVGKTFSNIFILQILFLRTWPITLPKVSISLQVEGRYTFEMC